MAARGQDASRLWRELVAGLVGLWMLIPTPGSAQLLSTDSLLSPPRPPAPINGPTAVPSTESLAPQNAAVAPPTSLAPPTAAPLPVPVPFQAPPVQPTVPPGQALLSLSARFGPNQPVITGALHWRVYTDKPDQSGVFRLIKEDRTASPTVMVPAGGYVVVVSFGLASAAKRIQLGPEQSARHVFELAAGGARFEGRVGDSKIPAGQISFDVFHGSQFEPGEKRPVAHDIATGDLVALPEGVYYVVSNYGDGNSVVRSDIRVQAAKLTDIVINHRAAVITLKLVNDPRGEALANTQWTVLTPGGDVIKESIGAFPRVVLAEGDYRVIARNEGKTFQRDFKVITGVDGEIEVLAR